MLGPGMLAAGPAAVVGTGVRALRVRALRRAGVFGIVVGSAAIAAVLVFWRG